MSLSFSRGVSSIVCQVSVGGVHLRPPHHQKLRSPHARNFNFNAHDRRAQSLPDPCEHLLAAFRGRAEIATNKGVLLSALRQLTCPELVIARQRKCSLSGERQGGVGHWVNNHGAVLGSSLKAPRRVKCLVRAAVMHSFGEQRSLVLYPLQALAKAAAIEALTRSGPSQAGDLPPDAAGSRRKLNNRIGFGTGASEENRLLRQPLDATVVVDTHVLRLVRGSARAAVKLGRTRRSDKRTALLFDTNIHVKRIAADNSTGWMQ